ncbi:antibiotic biosynthesis monooxygenase family protein [Kitasatospora sp. NPDC101183]|uniref:antibiotic biosynthesis monooxygenase family protein n=1 Tax=Kitasatospora sp. NPDC101183 TaxID=3364100 RepID=UPI0037FB02F3
MNIPVPAELPEPPYYAVIFTAVRTPGDNGYADTNERMSKLAAEQPGYLGIDSARGSDGLGLAVSYWKDEASIAAWRENLEHALARTAGREHWYSSYSLHVAKVERSYGFTRPADA